MTANKDSNQKLWVKTYEADNLEELDEAYKDWASDYDKDTMQGMGYVGPQNACNMLDTHLDDETARVLDAGCGTGIVGKLLSQLGYCKVDATDYSEHMLQEAESKGCYGRLFQGDMNEKLDVADNYYDAIVCVGTFTYAHVGPEGFMELVRITKPGGYICFTVRDGAYQEYGYRQKMLEMERDNIWEMLEMRDTDYLVKEGVTAKFCTYKVLEA